MKRCTVICILAVVLSCAVVVRIQAQAKAPDAARWKDIQKVFDLKGESDDGYFRINLSRTDLHVRIGADVLEPGLGFTSYAAFLPTGNARVMAMGEVVSTEEEAPKVVEQARRENVSVSALHNHELG